MQPPSPVAGSPTAQNQIGTFQTYRQKHHIIHKPIVFGTHAVYLGKKSPDNKTHKWCCYVRAVSGEDLSRFIAKVEFQIDESFPVPNIQISKPPFEIHQTGWGQFAIGIKLFFRDPIHKPVEVAKELILYDDLPPSSKRPLIREDYNELVFVQPSEKFLKMLLTPEEGGIPTEMIQGQTGPKEDEEMKQEESINSTDAAGNPT